MEYINEMKQEAARRAQRLQSLELESREPVHSPVKGFIDSVRQLVERRQLLGLLVRRELVGRYKDSVFGFAWSLIRPLTQLLIYYLVMGQFLGAARSIPNFAIYIFTGLTLWGLFSEMIQSMTGSVIANSGLVKKVYLPREIFPISTIGSALFNFGMQMVILLIAAGILGTLAFGPHLLYALVAVLIILAWGTSLGLILAATNVYLRDVQYLVEVLLMLLMWFSPIVYSWQMVNQVMIDSGLETVSTVYASNPVTLAILGFQAAFWAPGSGLETLYPDGYFPEQLMTKMLIALACGIVSIWISQRIFARLQGNFAQEL